METKYDIIIIGTGAGGGTILHKLQPSGKKILVLERGTFLPREKENWSVEEVFLKDRYHTKEVWTTPEGEDIHPGTGYWVGGNTKVYGGALFRLREKDFEKVQHAGGISPEWPLQYSDLAPYYDEAENLYQVHGKAGLDPTEPPRSSEYSHPPVSHEPRIQEVRDALKARGLHPFYIPLGIRLNEADPLHSDCIRCDTFDGFPCLVDGKSDSDITCIRPVMNQPNVTLLTGALVTRLLTDASGKTVNGVETDFRGEKIVFKSDIVILSAGAINSAALLLRSANDRHPNGLANSSDMVGRNFMKHQNAGMLAITMKPNPTRFQKTLAVNDFYWGDADYEFPMGHIQLMGKSLHDMLVPDAPGITPEFILEKMTTHSVDWWMTGEDLPDPENRVTLKNGQICLAYKENNTAGFKRLIERWDSVLKEIDDGHSFFPHHIYLHKNIPLAGVAHQCGTARFGENPATSVLDINCKAHDLDNLYVVDGSFFPASGAVNPSLTIMANALRIGEHITARMK